jgi:hypothetical protein
MRTQDKVTAGLAVTTFSALFPFRFFLMISRYFRNNGLATRHSPSVSSLVHGVPSSCVCKISHLIITGRAARLMLYR